ncbi:hypothetical protein [Kitasatospora sp. NPDC088783]|uniref:hypothetical protein n=1 Tax=Kitasatospora sp. NPDC088783 TaxID=3364077 RepID=UPI00380BA74A
MSRVIVVTDGGHGFADAAAQVFALQGDRVAFVSRSGGLPQDLSGLGILAVASGLESEAEVGAAFSTIEGASGVPQVVIADQCVTDITSARGREALLPGGRGLVGFATHAVQRMAQYDYGRLVIVNGGAPHRRTGDGVAELVEELALGGAKYRVTVNAVDAGSELVAPRPTPYYGGVYPPRDSTPGGPADFADLAFAARFLAGRGADYITGAVIPVDGGARLCRSR